MKHNHEQNHAVEEKSVTSAPSGTNAHPMHEDHDHAAQPSGPTGDNPATAGPGPTAVTSRTPENNSGQLNPSAPEDSNTTPGSTTDK